MSYRFSVFEVDPATGELRKQGTRIRIQDKPLQLLVALLEHPGEVVSRETLRTRLWPDGVHVEFDESLNTAVRRLRHTLGDVADPPRFIETVPRRGYRMLVPVDVAAGAAARLDTSAPGSVPIVAAGDRPSGWTPRRRWAAALALVALLLTAVLALRPSTSASSSEVSADIAPAPTMRLAVLPLQNLGGDPSKDYFADGLTEELITQIGRLLPERLGVIARTSAMRYRGVARDIRDVGAELRVDYVLEGSVRPVDGRLRIALRLVSIETGTQVWSDTYDRPIADAVRTQIDVVRAVGRALAADLLTGEPEALVRAGTTSGEAYDAALQGLRAMRLGTASGFDDARRQFERAVAADPGFALAIAGLAEVTRLETDFHHRPPDEGYRRALAQADRALARDPQLALAHATRADAHRLLGNRADAAQAFAQLLKLAQPPPEALVQYAWFLYDEGRHADALEQIERARLTDPLSPLVATAQAHLALLTGDAASALDLARAVVARDAAFPYASYTLGLVHEARGQRAEAVTAFEHAHAVGEGAPKYTLKLGLAYAAAGRTSDARRMLEEARRTAATRYVPPQELAELERGL